jgi:hypothetical protein
MSQRLIQPGRSAATRIGTTEAGTVVWSLAGGDGTGDEGANDDGKSGEEDDDSDDDGDEKDDDEGEDDDEDKPVYTQAEYDKIRRRMRAADKRAADFEEQNRKLKSGTKAKPVAKKTAKPAADADADDDGDDERDERAAKAEARAVRAEEKARTAAIETAMVRAMSKAGIDWADPDDVSKFLDLADIDVDEDGTVDSKQLVRALKDLAKRKPHLVKPKTQSGSDDDKDGKSDGTQGGTSAPTMNGKRKGDKTVDKTTLRRRFPSLRA